MIDSSNSELWKAIEPIISKCGLDFIGFETGRGKSQPLRVYIDSSSGVTVDDCARVSRALVAESYEKNIIFDRLEVSSPGIPRRIFTLKELMKQIGKDISIRLHTPLMNKKKFVGSLTKCCDLSATITVADRLIVLPFTKIKTIFLL